MKQFIIIVFFFLFFFKEKVYVITFSRHLSTLKMYHLPLPMSFLFKLKIYNDQIVYLYLHATLQIEFYIFDYWTLVYGIRYTRNVYNIFIPCPIPNHNLTYNNFCSTSNSDFIEENPPYCIYLSKFSRRPKSSINFN